MEAVLDSLRKTVRRGLLEFLVENDTGQGRAAFGAELCLVG